MMTDELFQACEFAKTAADMSIPVEPMPTPEPGSEAIEGMVNGSMMDPNSVGAGTYAGAVDAAALAQAKARAAAAAQAAAAQKTAAIEEAYMMGYEDAVAEFEEMNKEASVEDAYVLGYEAAVEELEKMAADAFWVNPGKGGVVEKMPNLTMKEKAQMRAKAKADAVGTPIKNKVSEKVTQTANRMRSALNNSKAVNAVRSKADEAALQFALGKMEAADAAKNLMGKANANKKSIVGGAAALGALAGAGVLGKRKLDAMRRAKMMRRAGIGAAALAGLGAAGYAASRARD